MSDETYEFLPSVKVLVLQFGLIAGMGIVVLGYIAVDPSRLGNQQIGQVILGVVGFLLVIALLRILVKILILRRTKYIVTQQMLHREYQLFYKQQSREVPLGQLRGMEFEQGRVQSVFGFGTLTFLTAGTNQSLGFLEFEHVNLPNEVRKKVREVSSIYDT